MSVRITKIDQEPIAQMLGDMPLKALDGLGTRGVIGAHHLPPIFGIQLTGERGRVDQVTKQHGELAPFRLGRRRGGGRRGRPGRGGGRGDRRRRGTRPDQDIAPLIHGEALALDEFVLQIVQGRVVELKLPLEGAVGQASATLEHGDRLVEDLLKGHDPPFQAP